jgi:hypothetical protein
MTAYANLQVVLDTCHDQPLSWKYTQGTNYLWCRGNGVETPYLKWHVAYLQATKVSTIISYQCRSIVHTLSVLNLLGVWIFPSSVGDTHQVGGFWIVVETWQFGVLWILGLQHCLFINLFNHR